MQESFAPSALGLTPIAVAIPCYRPHIQKLVRCLESIEAQTLKPEGVVVSCSSSREEDIPEGLASRFSFPLIVRTTPERRNAAQNRNTAAAILLDTFGAAVVSFFDADDVMHPQRLEFVRRVFMWLPGLKIVLHSFVCEEEVAGGEVVGEAAGGEAGGEAGREAGGEAGGEASAESAAKKFVPAWQTSFERLAVLRGVCRRAPSGCVVIEGQPWKRIHHSQASVRRSIVWSHRYPEEPRFERREDSLYCGMVVNDAGRDTAYIDLPLSWYAMEGKTIET